MLKIRYFKIEFPFAFHEFLAYLKQNGKLGDKIKILSSAAKEIVFSYTVMRVLMIRKFTDAGESIVESASTMDQHTIRLFGKNKKIYIAISDPPRGSRIISDFLDIVCDDRPYFVEPLEISPNLIEIHTSSFDSATLVSAKIRDFQVYDGAVGRLEITSHAGLKPEIAPFLIGKFHRVDSLTYEVSEKFTKGLIYYLRNGTLRVSTPLVDVAVSRFENSLGNE
jgi:hypothetical protein